MKTGWTVLGRWWVVWQLATLAAAKRTSLSISRQHQGDMFTTKDVPCSNDVCVGRSSGTAALLPQSSSSGCACQCLQHLPVFRDDMQICVEDIHECPLASFLSGTTYQKIPFVFLPLRGQIVYPSAEINFAGTKSPICVVSGSQYLTGHGWAELRNRNTTDSEPPFRLYRDEGRTFLQWLGEPELRMSMEGRLLMVSLMCKDMDNSTNIFMPCVAFRVAGSPMTIGAGVKEVSFSADAQATLNAASTSGMSGGDYAAIAVCSVLLGVIYVSAVLMYLHFRRRKNRASDVERTGAVGSCPGGGEEGVIKNNPLLRHCHENSGYISDHSCCSEDDDEPIAALPDDDITPVQPATNQVIQQVTCALVHPCGQAHEALGYERAVLESIHQDSSAIERLPEGDVSIVETLEGREDGPETVRAITAASTRRKLYFNPAYFDLELLLAPPPAALEFLTKIREVIAIAKHKMAAKRFLPSLLGIPEESDYGAAHHRGSHTHTHSVASGSVVTVRQGRRRECEGCPGCSRPHPTACQACCSVTPENKHRSIRKWLEDVPLVKPPSLPTEPSAAVIPPAGHKPTKLRSSTKRRAPDIPSHVLSSKQEKPETTSNEMDNANGKEAKLDNGSPLKTTTKKEYKQINDKDIAAKMKNTNKTSGTSEEVWNDILFKASLADSNIVDEKPKIPVPPPLSVCSIMSKGKEKLSPTPSLDDSGNPKVPKQLMDAVIKEFVDQRSLEPKPSPPVRSDSLPSNKGPTSMDYETDSLDRTLTRQQEEREPDGMRTPSDYGDIEVKINHNVANLPLDEELTMRNPVFNIKTGSMTISKLKSETEIEKENNDDHEYEIILMNPENDKHKKFNLPDILSRVEGYSLVSEVYVNDGYSFGSSSSIHSNESSCASLTNERTVPKIKYEEPGHLTIEVEDSPTNYEKTYDSDSFEPDTLDRKPSKFKINSEGQFEYQTNRDTFADSLERPTQISLRTTGSFRSDTLCWYDMSHLSDIDGSPLNRTYGSLREIFEAKSRCHRNSNSRSDTMSPVGSTHSLDTDCYSTMSWKRGKPKILRPEAKQARRQRQPSPPEYVPPRPPKAVYSNEYVVTKNGVGRGNDVPAIPPRDDKPPLPPKNGQVRSTSHRVAGLKTTHRPLPLNPAARGVLALASGHTSTSSDYEAVEPHSNNLGRRLEISLQKELQRKFEDTQEQLMKSRSQMVKNTRDKRNINFIRKQQRVSIVPQRTEDSGYLSSDSTGSECPKRVESLSETDDSLYDGASESGAESIATDSFFFGKFHKLSLANSVDSGVCNSVGASSVLSDSDSNISFVTVLPTENDTTTITTTHQQSPLNHIVVRH